MTQHSGLLFEQDQRVARITLNRPQCGNAISIPMAKALMEAAIRCDEDEGIRCVVLTGAGRFFCVGGDLKEFAAAGDRIGVFVKEITSYLHAAIARLARMNKPLVTAVNGVAGGAGLSLAILGDIAIAARSAQFTVAYTAHGLSPDGAATWLLPRLIGLRRAQELVLTNRRVSSEEAVQLGLMTRTVDDSTLQDEVGRIAAGLAAGSTGALGSARNLLLSSSSASIEQHMDAEARAIAALSRTRQGREGVAAFLQKRAPNFDN